MTVWGYVRVSTNQQSTENQRLAILEYANTNHLTVDSWISVCGSSRKSAKDRRIEELLDKVQAGNTLVVAELSRLGRSVGQIAMLVDELVKNNVKLVCLKEGIQLNGRTDIRNKVMLTMFSLFAEIERDLISERTKEGLARARAQGKLLGRPKGTLGKSKLDGKEKEIKDYMAKGVNRTNIARIYGVAVPTMNNFIRTRGLQR